MNQSKTTIEIADMSERYQSLARYSRMPFNTSYSRRLYNFLLLQGKKKAYQAALDFIACDEGQPKRQHHFITFGGDRGRGKTHLALGIGWHWLDNNMGVVRYWTIEELLDAMRREYAEPPQNDYGFALRSEFEHCQKADLLILDDLGAEKATEWAIAKLDELVDFRYINELATVFTTNLLFSQLPERVASRLQEGVTVNLEGPDYRKIIARERQSK